jgi:hypothetical protein
MLEKMLMMSQKIVKSLPRKMMMSLNQRKNPKRSFLSQVMMSQNQRKIQKKMMNQNLGKIQKKMISQRMMNHLSSLKK